MTQREKIYSVQDVRKSYIQFFESNRHLHVESASLIPAQDPTLLFTTAGMVPFKDYFSGAQRPPHSRLVSVQKCFRTTDLEEVGKTLRHLSFFEMLGNFSFGDYFKKEAIEFAWEYSTQHLPFLPEQIWITIFRNDDEAYNLWHNHIGIPDNRIVRLGERDNFWGPAGNTGACGPCSELYIDRGTGYSFDSQNAKPGGEGDRFMEFWNLVFNQFNKNSAGMLEPLHQTGIDTGAGVERLATLVQGVDSVYDTDELKNLRDEVARVYNANYEGKDVIPIRVLTDHIRALTFSLSDGIFPSNESRGYVLRRMLRRGLLFGRKLGQKEAQLYKLVKTVNEIYGGFYKNLNSARGLSEKYIRSEEERFLQTLDGGSQKLEEILDEAGARENQIIRGQEAFLLYDTFGFPLEMTIEMAAQKNIQVDVHSFQEKMEEQRERGRKAWKGSSNNMPQVHTAPTKFLGYQILKSEASLLAIISQGESLQSLQEFQLSKEQTFLLIFNQTPFYAESGGQTADSGYLTADTAKLEIIDVQKNGDQVIHLARSLEGVLHVGESYILQVDEARRKKITANHSATHLLNAGLRRMLGAHVKQSGSLVHENYLRFDFTHPTAMLDEEIFKVEQDVNQAIDRAFTVQTNEMKKSEAEKLGAVMAFGEKYGEHVRVVRMGNRNSPASLEFCGGTHVHNTSEIGFFLIQKESSPGAGNRRLEALTGSTARRTVQELAEELRAMFLFLQKEVQQLPSAFWEHGFQKNSWELILKHEKEIFSLNQNSAFDLGNHWNALREFKREIFSLETAIKKQKKKEAQKSSAQVDSALVESFSQETQMMREFFYLRKHLSSWSIPALKSLCDALREKNAKLIVLLSSFQDNKWNVVLASNELVCQTLGLDCNHLIKQSLSKSSLTGGGGGKKELAQASGQASDLDVLDHWLDELEKNIFAL